MATVNGVASNYLDLLTKLRDFLVANGWVQIGGTASGAITSDSEFVSLKALGLTGDDEILMTLQTTSVPASNAYALRLRGHTAYVNPGVNQPGSDSPWVYLLTLNSPIEYWIVANGRRFILIAKVSSRYDAMYGGFILPEHLPSDWSYPLFVGASCAVGNVPQASDAMYHSNFWNTYSFGTPANNDTPTSAYLFSPIQAWVPVRNGYSSTSLGVEVNTGRITVPWNTASLQNVRRQIDDAPWVRQGQLAAVSKTPSGTIDINVPEGGAFYGSFDGVYYTPSFGATAEQETVIGGTTFKMFPNISRTSVGQFAAIKMD